MAKITYEDKEFLNKNENIANKNKVNDTDLNQISLTSVRALVLLGLLMRAPRTFSEIKQTFVDLKIMEPDHSDDIIRIDLNYVDKYLWYQLGR